MFKHILLPVDGALTMVPLVRRCLGLAAASGARVEAVHVLPLPSLDGTDADAGVGRARAAQILQQVEGEAAAQGVRCEGRVVQAGEPWQAIVEAAVAGGADLICMGARGRQNSPGQSLGSQTAQVLAHPGVPVLVFR
ncbi:universal stress protein [Massilia sp. DWR3-1-1]|uniref:universal stress protein n=1 Tax=Massilia sp. DWR3-1-1 TaxID=2804559 RepID=UPI003CEA03E8